MEQVSFEGQSVVVTGAGSGLGRSYALEIARRGGNVVVNDLGGPVEGSGLSTVPSDRVVDEIRSAGGSAVASYDDVSSPAGGRRIIETALDNFRRIDAVVANAGNFRSANFEHLTADDLHSLMAVHIGGSWNVSQAAWPHMKLQGYGRLVFTSSSVGMFGTRNLTAYGAAKGGVMGLMHNLSCEGAANGIVCNAIMPNAITRMTESAGESDHGDNTWSSQVVATLDPSFATGLATFLASSACGTSHGLYSSLGGRVARTFIGVTKGHQGSRSEPTSADEIAAHWKEICDDRCGYGIPLSVADEYRYVVAGDALLPD